MVRGCKFTAMSSPDGSGSLLKKPAAFVAARGDRGKPPRWITKSAGFAKAKADSGTGCKKYWTDGLTYVTFNYFWI